MNRGLFGAFDYDTWLSTPPEPWSEPDVDEDEAYDRWKDNVAMGYEQKKEKTLKKRLRLKKFKQLLQDDMLANVWDGSYRDKRRIIKMSHIQMIKELHEEWLNQTGYPRIMDFD